MSANYLLSNTLPGRGGIVNFADELSKLISCHLSPFQRKIDMKFSLITTDSILLHGRVVVCERTVNVSQQPMPNLSAELRRVDLAVCWGVSVR